MAPINLAKIKAEVCFNLDDEKLNHILNWKNVIAGVFKVAKKLFGRNLKKFLM